MSFIAFCWEEKKKKKKLHGTMSGQYDGCGGTDQLKSNIFSV